MICLEKKKGRRTKEVEEIVERIRSAQKMIAHNGYIMIFDICHYSV